ncbi:DUF2180 family protein [Streptomyces sp. NPDC056161]|uniref:DUF2180 family protein n=1 Tax=Streptomyces sp. NPDC056161 TaxID=3345732 RepID=UPI0035E0596B
MNCYDCARTGAGGRSAIGICSFCGLAVCATHARVDTAAGKHTAGVVVVTRLVACNTCSGVQTAA